MTPWYWFSCNYAQKPYQYVYTIFFFFKETWISYSWLLLLYLHEISQLFVIFYLNVSKSWRPTSVFPPLILHDLKLPSLEMRTISALAKQYYAKRI